MLTNYIVNIYIDKMTSSSLLHKYPIVLHSRLYRLIITAYEFSSWNKQNNGHSPSPLATNIFDFTLVIDSLSFAFRIHFCHLKGLCFAILHSSTLNRPNRHLPKRRTPNFSLILGIINQGFLGTLALMKRMENKNGYVPLFGFEVLG